MRLKGGFDISTDNVTVWINGPDGCNAGRFGRMGIDIHRSYDEQKKTGEQCLHCTAGPVTAADWETFKIEMNRHYGVVVTDRFKPKRFR